MDFNKNDLKDACLQRFFVSNELTLDTALHTDKRFLSWIKKSNFKDMKKNLKLALREHRKLLLTLNEEAREKISGLVLSTLLKIQRASFASDAAQSAKSSDNSNNGCGLVGGQHADPLSRPSTNPVGVGMLTANTDATSQGCPHVHADPAAVASVGISNEMSTRSDITTDPQSKDRWPMLASPDAAGTDPKTVPKGRCR